MSLCGFPQDREDLWKMNSNCILKYSIKTRRPEVSQNWTSTPALRAVSENWMRTSAGSIRMHP